MNMILIGNMVSLAGCIAMIMTGFLKKRKSIISLQCLQFALMGIGNVILGGISGALSNVLGIVRDLFSMKVEDFNRAWKVTFIALQAVLTALVNKAGLVGWLPVLATAAFTMVMDGDEKAIKWSIIFGESLWFFYDITNHNYTAVAMDAFTVISNLIGIAMLRKDEAGTQSLAGN